MGNLLEHFEYILSGSDNMLALLDKDFVYLRVNNTYLNTFGKTRESTIGYSVDEVLGKEYFEENIKPNAENIQPWKYEICCNNFAVSHNNIPLYYEITYLPYFGQDHEVQGFVVNGLDITKRKKAEKALEEIEDIYFTLFSNLSDPIIIFEEKTNLVLDYNQAAINKYGYSLEEFRKLIRYNLHSPEELKRIDKNILNLENNCSQYYTHFNKTGKNFSAEVHTARTNYNGKKAYISMIKDVTRSRVLEDEIKEARIKAEESEKLKSAFLANLSHEIRTPLNSIMGFSNLLNEADNNENREEFIRIINESGDQLLKVIDDVMQVSKIEAGLIQIKIEEFNLNTLLNDLMHIYELHEKVRNNKINLFMLNGLPDKEAWIKGDRYLIRKVLANIIENAIKFTKKGKIEIAYELIIESDLEYLEFHIKDTGIGISPEKKKVIFERFRQADMSSSREHGGTGLGLTISKAIINLLGGIIWVDSLLFKGSTFYFSM